MKLASLSILKCPECSRELAVDSANVSVSPQTAPAGEILEGRLVCPSGHAFPILRGISRFVSNEQYSASFGFEWNVFSRTQLDDGVAGKASRGQPGPPAEAEKVSYAGFVARKGHESEDAFYCKTGLKPEELAGKRVLDAGCGTGRFAAVALAAGAEVVACDLSLAAEACYGNLAQDKGIHVLQADIFRLPFAPETFDVIYSIGVLHHTPDTRKAFLSLVPLLKPGARICIWVYQRLPWRWGLIPPWYWMSDVYRRWTSRWPSERLLRFSRCRARLHPLMRLPVLGRFFERVWPGSVHPDYEWRVLDTFDWYSPVYQWKHTAAEVEGWFREAGLTEIKEHPFPISFSGKRED